MPYIATKPGTAFRTFTDKDTFSGDGSTTVFDMQFAIAEAGQNDLQIFVILILRRTSKACRMACFALVSIKSFITTT